jgi:polyphosphate glucokinase
MPTSPNLDKSTKILSIDIGGSSIKACLITLGGDVLSDYTKLPTPLISTPQAVLEVIKQLAATLPGFECIAVGFPGYVKYGKVQTAPNLAKKKWKDVDLAQQISNLFRKPVRLINDADQQALAIVKGKGFEIVITLGTGFGTALLFDGQLLPHLELAHLPISKNKDYDDYIGDKAFKEIGKKDWNERLQRIIEIYKTVFNYDQLYIGGGNAKEIDFELEENIKLVNNRDGIKGGAKLWAAKERYHVYTTNPTK